MYGSGAATGMGSNIMRRALVHEILLGLVQGNIVFFAAVRGPTIQSFVGLLTASGTIRTAGATISVSGSCEAIKLGSLSL